MIDLENRLKPLETTVSFMEYPSYLRFKEKLDNLQHKQVNSLRIRTKHNYHECAENSMGNIFFNSEKTQTNCEKYYKN